MYFLGTLLAELSRADFLLLSKVRRVHKTRGFTNVIAAGFHIVKAYALAF